MRALPAIALAFVACAPQDAGPVAVAMATQCGPGTHEESGTCVPDAGGYHILANTQIAADGTTPVAVVVYGTQPDGTPATDAIVLDTDRTSAGAFEPPTLTLGELGGVASFVPCSSASPGCLGLLHLTVALASAPNTSVADVAVELVAPPVIGSAEHCLTGGNMLYLEGQGFGYDGRLTVDAGSFSASGGNEHVAIDVVPDDPLQGSQWSLTFDTVQLGSPLNPGDYLDAFDNPPVGHPKLAVVGPPPFGVCKFAVVGEFHIYAYTATPTPQLTASFRATCSALPGQVLSGCVHVE